VKAARVPFNKHMKIRLLGGGAASIASSGSYDYEVMPNKPLQVEFHLRTHSSD
jgi:hypothetical protein